MGSNNSYELVNQGFVMNVEGVNNISLQGENDGFSRVFVIFGGHELHNPCEL